MSDGHDIRKTETQIENNDEALDDDDDAEPEPKSKQSSWADHSFLKPLRVLQELSGFSTLNVLYKILVSIPVTSSSAERAMSRVRLTKNRLRTTMVDDWLSSLMILASEKDILKSIPVDRIIDHFATLSILLRKLLIM